MADSRYTPHAKLVIRADHRGFFGPGIAELLSLIEQTGSLKDACREMGMSYSKGRTILSRAESCLDYALIEKQPGGVGGGSTHLTEEGASLLRCYHVWEEDLASYLQESFQKHMADAGLT
ncbi:MAG: hypothetical protein Q4B09_09810 [Lachnospiraceae bacterium]|nr:hypothetical protein [Lachnospiraceae bacterium]